MSELLVTAIVIIIALAIKWIFDMIYELKHKNEIIADVRGRMFTQEQTLIKSLLEQPNKQYVGELEKRIADLNATVANQKQTMNEMTSSMHSLMSESFRASFMSPEGFRVPQPQRNETGPVPPACPARRVRVPVPVQDRKDTHSDSDQESSHTEEETQQAEHPQNTTTAPPPSPRYGCLCVRRF